MKRFSRSRRRWLPIFLLLLGVGLALPSLPSLAQEAPQPAAEEAPDSPDAYRLLGPPLFPLYDHYLRTADNTRVLNILYLYGSSENPSGHASQRLLPFYYWSRDLEPEDFRLNLFPLLYFHRSGEEARYNFQLPLFYDYRSSKRGFQAFVPLWARTHDVEEAATSHHFLFPLSRLRFDEKDPEAPVVASRFGIWKVLELGESYAKGKDERRTAALSLFNFGEEAKSPIALYHSQSRLTIDGSRERRTHLFPIYWSGKNVESSYRHIAPLYWRGTDADGGFLFVAPVAGYVRSAGSEDLYLPFLLSRFGESLDGEVRRDIIWPLYSRRFGPKLSSFYSVPLFRWKWTPKKSQWRTLEFVYGQEYYPDSEKTAHTVLWPLGRIDVEPDGVTGERRVLPFYFDKFDDTQRYRITPLFYNRQKRSGTKVDYNFTFALPDYFGWGAPDDYKGVGFPLYWKRRAGLTGWDLFLPIYYSFFRSASFGVHVLPILSYNSYPSEKQIFVGGPAFVHRRFYDFEEKPAGRAVSLLWPLTEVQRRPEGYHYRLLPLFWTSKDRDVHDLLLFPLWYRQWGGDSAHDYFFLAYGRYETPHIKRDFYGAGSYIHTEEKDDDGNVFRTQDDILWSLLSFQENTATHATHKRILPLAYWSTKSVPEDRTVLGPFRYSHRLDSTETDRTYKLDLTLGNVWLEKTVLSDTEPSSTPGEAYRLPQSGDTSKRAALSPLGKYEVSRERGVLWPLLRWGEDHETGVASEWALPLYFHRKSDTRDTRAFFPLSFISRFEGEYAPNYFRNFFLYDFERWGSGYRVTFGQFLADWMRDHDNDTYRWRFFYPLAEYRKKIDGYSYQITPFCMGNFRQSGGERLTSHFLFPFYWQGGSELETADGSYRAERTHFYIFPFYGINEKPLWTQRDFLLPFFHLARGIDSMKFQFRPFFFYRNDPEEQSVRLWPLHSYENGEASGDWWVSKYLYFSKYARRKNSRSYRLDPFLFRIQRAEDASGFSAFFELFAYDRKISGNWEDLSYRALPLAYGYSRENESGFLSFPLYYNRNLGTRPIDYLNPWRFLFLFNHLRGSGERYTSFLWKGLEYRANPSRPDFHEFRILYALYQDLKSESYRQLAMQPFFFYSFNLNREDPLRPEKDIFILPALGYRYHEVAGSGTHYLLWFLPIWKS